MLLFILGDLTSFLMFRVITIPSTNQKLDYVELLA